MPKKKRYSQASGQAPAPSSLQKKMGRNKKSPAQRAAESAARAGTHLIDKVTFWD